MDDPPRPSRIQDEPRDMEEEEGEREVAATMTTSNGASESRDSAETRAGNNGRTPLAGDNVNGHGNNNGEPAGSTDRVIGREQTEDHQRLDSQFRELREMLPLTSRTSSTDTGTGPSPAERDNNGEASGHGGGLTSDTTTEDERDDLLDRVRLRILSLEREQRLLAAQNGQLERLLEDRTRGQD